MLGLYPPIKPYAKHSIAVTSPHVLYVEECGEPSGIPVLFVHGGPGAGCDATSRQYFDPEKYRIILFDQRGCGRSKPHAELENNTTHELIKDIDTIREYLNIDKWILFGGSWGATLSLVYAQAYPNNTMGLILRGTFLGRAEDIMWFYGNGTRYFFPDCWEEFIKPIPEEEHDNLLVAYYKRLIGQDDLIRMGAAKAWATYEGRSATLEPRRKYVDHCAEPFFANSFARISCHYMVNDCFLEPNQILDNMSIIEQIPSILVHGRYDMICPLQSAWVLHKQWPASELNIVRDAGHAPTEPAIVDALILATKDMAKRFGR